MNTKMLFNSINRENNMNCVRYYLCLCILMNHYNVLSESTLPSLPRIFGGVGSFFAISGFLMFSSYEKHNNLKGYFVRRAKRIFPPYVFIVLLAAVGLSAVSTLSPGDYFTNADLYKYLVSNLCFLNFLQPDLPGVFESNYIQAINGSLWTMKGEVICYILVPVVFYLLKKNPQYRSFFLSFIMLACFGTYMFFTLHDDGEGGMMEIVAKQFRVFSFFFAGALINVHLQKFLKYKWIVLAIVLALMGLAELNPYLHLSLRPFTDSMLVIWCSMVGTWGVWASHTDSLSYDIYLFHYPIIQLLLATGVVAGVGLFAGLLIVCALSVLLAIFSWNLIDRPILRGWGENR